MKQNRNKMILSAFLLQILVLLSVIALVYVISAKGQTVTLTMTGYDPYDALRGRYIRLSNPDSRVILDPGSIERYENRRCWDPYVYVVLNRDPGTGLSSFSYASLDRPDPATPYIRCSSDYLRTYEGESWVSIHPRIDQYYLTEKHAGHLDQSIRWDTPVRLTLKIWHGMYAIDGIEVDGQAY